MASIGEMILKLESRIIALEKKLNIKVDKTDLIHPKSISQFEAKKADNILPKEIK